VKSVVYPAICGLSFNPAIPSVEAPIMPIEFKQHTLDNGLTILAECNDDAHTGAIGFFAKTGARDETKDLMGVSHFLEHMMFKGTARRSADDVNREFDEIGANYNAFTSHELTGYFAHVLPEHVPQATDLLADIMMPALREEDFNTERNVILEEIGMYEDQPEWRLQDTILEDFYGNHPLGHRVLGTGGEDGTVAQLNPDQMRDYFTKRYSPDNLVVSAAGRVDFDRLVKELEALTKTWQPQKPKRDYAAPEPAERARTIVDASLSRHYLALCSPAPSAQDERRFAAKVLGDVLGDTEGSRLYWALVDPGLAEAADLGYLPQDQAGCFFAFASCDPDRAKQVEDKLLQTLDTFGQDVTDDEVQRAKNKLATQATVQGEAPAGRMRNLGIQWHYLGRYLSLEEELDQLMAVTAEQVRQLARDYPFHPRTLERLGPKEPK
jgi:predicted Zn-dependent peptidase